MSEVLSSSQWAYGTNVSANDSLQPKSSGVDTLLLLPNDKTYIDNSIHQAVKVGKTYTLDSSALNFAPVGYEYSPNLVFNGNGFVFGSGVLFWAKPVYTNNSGGTRTGGPFGVVAANVVYQANGGSLTTQAVDFSSNNTYQRINSGSLTMSNTYSFWAQGGTIGAGTTVTNRYHFVTNPTVAVSGTLTNDAGFVSTNLQATNKTHFLMDTSGTITVPSGTWGIYQRSTEDNLLSGNLQLSARLKKNQGADVASANNLVLGSDGNTFEITGTTQINLISNLTWQNGSQITLLFTSTPTVKHNQATSSTNITIQLAGAVDFAATAGDTLTLVLSEIGGTQAWREISRSVI